MARLQLLVLIGLLLVTEAAGLMATAHADAPSPTDAAYSELIQLAHGAYDAGDWTEAKKHFQAAHARYPTAQSLHGLGTVELQLRDFAIAAQHLTQALDSAELPLAGPVRSETEAAVREARSHVGYAQLFVSPDSAQIKLNDRVLPHGAVLVLSPGVYRLALSAEGYQAESREVTVMPGQHQLVQAFLEPSPPRALVSPAPTPAPAAPTPPPAAPKNQLHTGPLLLLGASGALFVVGGLLLAKGVLAHNRGAPPADSERYRAYQRDRERYPRFEASGAALLCAGGIAGVVGLWWHDQPAREARLRVSYAGDRLLVDGRF